jgi:hypothetical protein
LIRRWRYDFLLSAIKRGAVVKNIFVVLMLLNSAAWAQTLICKDAKGRSLTIDPSGSSNAVIYQGLDAVGLPSHTPYSIVSTGYTEVPGGPSYTEYRCASSGHKDTFVRISNSSKPNAKVWVGPFAKGNAVFSAICEKAQQSNIDVCRDFVVCGTYEGANVLRDADGNQLSESSQTVAITKSSANSVLFQITQPGLTPPSYSYEARFNDDGSFIFLMNEQIGQGKCKDRVCSYSFDPDVSALGGVFWFADGKFYRSEADLADKNETVYKHIILYKK